MEVAIERAYPVPRRRWSVAMGWHDLLFLHWPIPVKDLRKLIPSELEIDTFDGHAWLGIVPFHMSGVRPRWLPNVPGFSRFPELNVRSYVTADEKPGVWFHSLDADNALAVWLARRMFHLPYYNARISVEHEDEWICYQSKRTHRGGGKAEFCARYRPAGHAYQSKQGNLDRWLTARYCLYASDPQGRLWRGEIDHNPWRLQPAEAELQRNTMTDPLGIRLPDVAPLLHFCRRIDAVAWKIEPIAK